MKRILALAVMLLVVVNKLSAHAINYGLETAPTSEVFWFYGKLGFLHILPFGLDHILFVIGLCLLSNHVKTIAWQATAFTVAHSITLALSLKGIIAVPPAIVEPLIALSIAFIAVENILFKELHAWRILVIFGFGLIHGMGFASSLNEIGLPRNQFIESIIAFNLGVEAGQLAIILFVYSVLVRLFGQKIWYRKRIVFPLSGAIALLAMYWTVERLINLN